MKKIIGVILSVILLVGVGLTGCSEMNNDSDSKQQSQQEKILKEASKQTGMPNITHFFEKKMMKDIIELRDNPQLTTYVYTQNEMSGKFVFLGRAIGFGLPYSTQYTNPDKIADSYVEGGFAILPQADPNGLFSPDSAEATWIMLVNEQTNEPEITYMEPRTIVVQSKLPARLVESWSLPANY